MKNLIRKGYGLADITYFLRQCLLSANI